MSQQPPIFINCPEVFLNPKTSTLNTHQQSCNYRKKLFKNCHSSPTELAVAESTLAVALYH